MRVVLAVCWVWGYATIYEMAMFLCSEILSVRLSCCTTNFFFFFSSCATTRINQNSCLQIVGAKIQRFFRVIFSLGGGVVWEFQSRFGASPDDL